MDSTGFGTRSGAVYRNEGGRPGWCWYVGSEYVRGPYSSKAKAVASRNRYLRSLERKERADG
jgi:hypothetical protein